MTRLVGAILNWYMARQHAAINEYRTKRQELHDQMRIALAELEQYKGTQS